MTIFAVNCGQESQLPLEGDLRGIEGYKVLEHIVLESPDPSARNTIEQPNKVVPHRLGYANLEGGRLFLIVLL